MNKKYVPFLLGVWLWGRVQAQETLNAPLESAKALSETNESHLLLRNTSGENQDWTILRMAHKNANLSDGGYFDIRTSFGTNADRQADKFQIFSNNVLRSELDGTGKLNLYSGVFGVNLMSSNGALIGRGAAFSSGRYAGMGRAGLFLDNKILSLGIPNEAGAGFQLQANRGDSQIDKNLLTVDISGKMAVNGNEASAQLHVLPNPNTPAFRVDKSDNSPALTIDNAGKTIVQAGLQLPNGAANGRVLTSDANGNATWQPAPSGGGGIVRLTSVERRSVQNPELGMLVYDTDQNSLYYFDSANWQAIGNANQGLKSLALPTTVTANARYGNSVVVNGFWMAVSAPYESVDGKPEQGAVYLFRHNPEGGWRFHSRLTDFEGRAYFHFGWAIDLKGNQLLVGSPDATVNTRSSVGHAIRFAFENDAWVYKQQFFSPNLQTDDQFGWSVAMLDNNFISDIRAAIGCPGHDSPRTNNGGLFVYRNWSLEYTFTAPTDPSTAAGKIGYSVAGDFDMFVTGAPDKSVVYQIRFTTAGWEQTERWQNNNLSGFGVALAVSNDRSVAIGIRWDGYAGSNGIVYQFSGTTYTPRNIPRPADYYGLGQTDIAVYSIDISGNLLAIGSPFARTAAYSNVGRVYLYERIGNDWVFLKSILPPQTHPGETYFGSAVKLIDNHDLITDYHNLIIGGNGMGNLNRPNTGGVLMGNAR
jgi:hypothetical protein